MSRRASVELACPACPACACPQRIRHYTSVNVQRRPQVRQELRDGQFHVFACQDCGHRFHLEMRYGWLDLSRRQWFAVFPRTELPRWEACERAARSGFFDGAEGAPVWWLDVALTTRLRVVFGTASLAEKLLLDAHGLDDVVIEVIKERLGIVGARVTHVVFGDLLMVPAGEERALGVPRQYYELLASQRPLLCERHSELFLGPFVDARRLAS